MKKGADGEIEEIVLTESKFQKNGGKPRLKDTQNMGQQMSKDWVNANIEKMIGSADPDVRQTGYLLLLNKKLINKKAAVINSRGIQKWFDVP